MNGCTFMPVLHLFCRKNTVMYKKIVNKGSLDYCYLKTRLDFEEGTRATIDEVQFKQLVLEAVQSLFGLALSCSLIDVLKFDPADNSAILRIEHRNLVKVWSSLTLCGNAGGAPCAFRVLQVSPHLLALSADSRDMTLEVIHS
ncbi:ribonuclease P protein subunit p14-like [Mya arenaria]|uniref:ribonuclease P protein subunit p14-like n=1 Tax=Mya arenaria TaxID=6604 RepID=UPI0022E768D8|nr:ribonuclease P protein subunit p14-like [Mya arenaria]